MKKLGAIEWILIIVAVLLFAISLCVRTTEAAEIDSTQPPPEADAVSPQLLADIREASEKFQFCFKTDGDIYKLFDEYFPQYDSTDYNRFFVSIPTSSIVFYFIPNDCTFSGTASVLRFDKPCLKLTYGFTTQNYVTTTVPATTYFSSGNTAFRNSDILVDNAVLLPKNIDYFYAVNVDTTPKDGEPIDYTDHLGFIMAALVLLIVFVLIMLIWKI